jgi:tol-pal system protein YbgF
MWCVKNRRASAFIGGSNMFDHTPLIITNTMFKFRLPLIAILFSLPFIAHAGLFDDDEARKQIKQLVEKVEAQNKENDAKFVKLDESIKNLGIIQLLNQIELLNGEIARLRGQIEVLNNQNELLQKRQKDFYFDIDTRLRTLEGGSAPAGQNANPQTGSGVSGINAPNSPPNGGFVITPVVPATAGTLPPSATTPSLSTSTAAKPSPADAAQIERENSAYDLGSAANRRGDFTAAIRAFQTFIADYPQSQLTPNAIYWIGLAQFNLKDYRAARTTQEGLLKKYPDSSKTPDAMLVIASAQTEMNENTAARNTFQEIIAKYPTSDAAAKARTRLNGVRSNR